MHLQGQLCRRPATRDNEDIFVRRVLCAVLLKALEDAQRGDTSALAWLDDTGQQWCEVLKIPVDDWQAAAARLKAAPRETDRAGYWTNYYHQNKDDPVYQERQRANKARYLAKREAERAQNGA